MSILNSMLQSNVNTKPSSDILPQPVVIVTQPPHLLIQESNSYIQESQQIKESIPSQVKEGKPLQLKYQGKESKVQPSSIMLQTQNRQVPRAKSSQVFSDKRLPQERVSLRDYLFMAKTSVNRVLTKRNEFDSKRPSPPKQQLQRHQRNLKKDKYKISNKEVYEILRLQITSEIAHSRNELNKLQEFFESSKIMIDNEEPSNDDMIYMYKTRRLLKEKVVGGIEDIKIENMRHNTLIYAMIQQNSLSTHSHISQEKQMPK